MTFARALRAILRQDPDVVMVGEIRDEETAEIAVRAAVVGRMVLSTIHTNDAVSAINRLHDLGVPRYLIAATLRGVLSQRLVRRPDRQDGRAAFDALQPRAVRAVDVGGRHAVAGAVRTRFSASELSSCRRDPRSRLSTWGSSATA